MKLEPDHKYSEPFLNPATGSIDCNLSLAEAAINITKKGFVAANTSFVSAKNVCRDKHKFCRYKTSVLLSRQTFFFSVATKQAYFCRDKHVFVATKIILVAAPTSDSNPRLFCSDKKLPQTENLRRAQELCENLSR